jgi:hypothetical protein
MINIININKNIWKYEVNFAAMKYSINKLVLIVLFIVTTAFIYEACNLSDSILVELFTALALVGLLLTIARLKK